MSTPRAPRNRKKREGGWPSLWGPIRDLTSLGLSALIVVSAIFVPGPHTAALLGLVPVLLGLTALARGRGS